MREICSTGMCIDSGLLDDTIDHRCAFSLRGSQTAVMQGDKKLAATSERDASTIGIKSVGEIQKRARYSTHTRASAR